MDACGPEFLETFSQKHIDWVVSSPPYDSTSSIGIISNALKVAQRGICMKVCRLACMCALL